MRTTTGTLKPPGLRASGSTSIDDTLPMRTAKHHRRADAQPVDRALEIQHRLLGAAGEQHAPTHHHQTGGEHRQADQGEQAHAQRIGLALHGRRAALRPRLRNSRTVGGPCCSSVAGWSSAVMVFSRSSRYSRRSLTAKALSMSWVTITTVVAR